MAASVVHMTCVRSWPRLHQDKCGKLTSVLCVRIVEAYGTHHELCASLWPSNIGVGPIPSMNVGFLRRGCGAFLLTGSCNVRIVPNNLLGVWGMCAALYPVSIPYISLPAMFLIQNQTSGDSIVRRIGMHVLMHYLHSHLPESPDSAKAILFSSFQLCLH